MANKLKFLKNLLNTISELAVAAFANNTIAIAGGNAHGGGG